MSFVPSNPGGWTDKIDGPEASQLNHIQANLVAAIDGVGGGRYLPLGPLNISDASGGGLGNSVIHGQLRLRGPGQPRTAWKTGSLPNTDDQTLGIASGGQILRFAPSAALRRHQMDNAGATAGDWIVFISTAGSGNTLSLYKAGASPAYLAADLIVECAAGAHVCAELYFDGLEWRLGKHSPSATPGASA